MTAPVVGIAGLTHLGVVSAAAAASRGLAVVAYDPDPSLAGALRMGRPELVEPGLDKLLEENHARLEVVDNAEALRRCAVVFIASDVPTDTAGRSDLSGVQYLVERVMPHLDADAVLVVLCQVPPGFTRAIALEPRRLFYQVETLVFGRAVERALKPERFIVGCSDPARNLPPTYAEVLGRFDCPVLRMRYESAELAKIAINCVLAASLSMTNTLAELAERIGADWREIAPALRLDARIGPHAYLAPGLGIGGGNIVRDLATVQRLAREVGSEAGVIDAIRANSAHRRDWALRVLHAWALKGRADATVGILGLAYKENTRSTHNSAALGLAAALRPWRLRVYDPVVPASAVDHPAAIQASSALDAARGAAALAVMTPWPEFRGLDPAALARVMAGRTIVDPYGVLDVRAAKAAGLDHAVLGAPPAHA